MLDALKFVQRGIARRDYVPGLTYFRIQDRRATGYNGAYAVSAPVDIGFNIAVKADAFTEALADCDEVISLKLEGDGTSLVVISGKFISSIPCLPIGEVPSYLPEGAFVTPHESILDALASLQPFIGSDEHETRAWATGILFRGQSAYATNNMVIAEYWLGTPFPHVVNIPSAVVNEVVKVNEEIAGMQISTNSITFHYADGRWIKAQLLTDEWPNVEGVLNGAWDTSNLEPVPVGLADACELLTKYAVKRGDSRLYFRGDEVSTHCDGIEGKGTQVKLVSPSAGIYHTLYLNQVLAVAEYIDFSKYPTGVPFRGSNLRGVMLGQVQ